MRKNCAWDEEELGAIKTASGGQKYQVQKIRGRTKNYGSPDIFGCEKFQVPRYFWSQKMWVLKIFVCIRPGANPNL